MPQVRNFEFSVEPNDMEKFTKTTDSIYKLAKEKQTELDSPQLEATLESFHLIQQTNIVNNREIRNNVVKQAEDLQFNLGTNASIYGKANLLEKERETILQNYKENSVKDANRYSDVYFNFDNQTNQKINLANIKKKYNIEENSPLEIDTIVNYIQDEYNVAISNEQRNFLRTQIDQSNLPGVIVTPIALGIGKESLTPYFSDKKVELNFKSNKLESVTFESTTKCAEHTDKAGVTRVVADISNLASENKSAPYEPILEDYLPKYNAKKITLSYRSDNGLNPHISDELYGIFKKCDNFKERSKLSLLVNDFKKNLSNLISKLKKPIKAIFRKELKVDPAIQENILTTKANTKSNSLMKDVTHFYPPKSFMSEKFRKTKGRNLGA